MLLQDITNRDEALAEIGDKTQLLALVLAARFKKPWPIIAGILVATLANHALAGSLGAWASIQFGPQTMRWILGASFLAMAAWMLIPDKNQNWLRRVLIRAPVLLKVFRKCLRQRPRSGRT